jgi:hypothetical protein
MVISVASAAAPGLDLKLNGSTPNGALPSMDEHIPGEGPHVV